MFPGSPGSPDFLNSFPDIPSAYAEESTSFAYLAGVMDRHAGLHRLAIVPAGTGYSEI